MTSYLRVGALQRWPCNELGLGITVRFVEARGLGRDRYRVAIQADRGDLDVVSTEVVG